jgi:hypothetical protein
MRNYTFILLFYTVEKCYFNKCFIFIKSIILLPIVKVAFGNTGRQIESVYVIVKNVAREHG